MKPKVISLSRPMLEFVFVCVFMQNLLNFTLNGNYTANIFTRMYLLPNIQKKQDRLLKKRNTN